MIEITKHTRRNSNIPEELDRTCQKDGRGDTTNINTSIPMSGKTKYTSTHKEMEKPIPGRELRNTGLTNLVNSSRSRRIYFM
jgi:hypothetical protein